MVGGGDPLLPEILGQTYPVGAKNVDFQSIFARSKQVQLTLIGSPLCTFQWA